MSEDDLKGVKWSVQSTQHKNKKWIINGSKIEKKPCGNHTKESDIVLLKVHIEAMEISYMKLV